MLLSLLLSIFVFQGSYKCKRLNLKILIGLCRDSSILNVATHNTQLWGHSGTSGRSCITYCLQVLLISFSFPGPPSGTLSHSWWGLHKFGCW